MSFYDKYLADGVPRGLNAWAKVCYERATSKGFDAKDVEETEVCQLILTEIAEATEAYRKGMPLVCQLKPDGSVLTAILADFQPGVKLEGELTELADAVIRIGNYFGYMGWDLEAALDQSFQIFQYERACQTWDELEERIQRERRLGHPQEEKGGEKALKEHFFMSLTITGAGCAFNPKHGLAFAIVQITRYALKRHNMFFAIIAEKMKYNATRQWKHGGKVV